MALSRPSSFALHFPPKPPSLEIGKELSRGAYGAVHSGRLDGREVAVKRIHRLLLEAAREQGDLEKMLDDFRHECDLLKRVDHPHVVKFEGAFYDETTDEPILVMELMTETLRQYLLRNRGQLSRQKQLEICVSIVRGLRFLHTRTPPVVHRDLTDKNVLLDANGVVKISDLGQSRLKTAEYFSTGQPGAIPFMSPEAMQDPSRYNEKLDVFSLGVLMLEVATQQSPRVNMVGIGVTPELRRRREDLSRLDEDHPLRPVILSCLKDNPRERPDIATVLTQLLEVKEWSRDGEGEPTQNKGRREEEEMRFMEPMGEVQDPPHQGEETEGEGEVWSEPASPYSAPYPGPLTPPHPLYPPTFGMGPWPPAQMAPPRVSLLPSLSPPAFSGAGQHTLQTPSTQHTAQMGPSQHGQLQSVQSTASRTTQEVCSPASGSEVFQTSQLLEDQPTLHSVRLPDLPIATSHATALVIARNVYVCGGRCPDVASACVVQVYDLDKATWTKLPPAPQCNSEAAAINNQLVLIGGWETSSHTITNMVSTWTGQGWQQDIPAMPTKRGRPGVTTYNTYLMVAGGVAEDNQTLLGSIDVMDTTTRQYTSANLHLPRPMHTMQITVSATHICVASAVIAYNATTNTDTFSNSVWELPVSTLSKVLVGEDGGPHQWTKIAPTPHYCSALLQDTAHPLAVGGRNDSLKSTTDIAVYDRHSNKWSTVGQLLEPRVRCTAVSLSRRSFLVCGGLSDPRDINTLLSSVEVVSVQ